MWSGRRREVVSATGTVDADVFCGSAAGRLLWTLLREWSVDDRAAAPLHCALIESVASMALSATCVSRGQTGEGRRHDWAPVTTALFQ